MAHDPSVSGMKEGARGGSVKKPGNQSSVDGTHTRTKQLQATVKEISQGAGDTYEERLLQMVESEVPHVVPASTKRDGNKKRSINVTLLTREGAIEHATKDLAKRVKELEQTEMSAAAAEGTADGESRGSGAAGGGSGAAGGQGESSKCKKEGYSYEERHDTVQEKPAKQEPFGPRKNIHTIHTSRDNSTKDVKAVGRQSNIVGFTDRR